MDRSFKSNLRTLLRGHTKRISDVKFFSNNQSNQNDVIGTVAGREWDADVEEEEEEDEEYESLSENGDDEEEEDVANVLIWRIYKREDELGSEKLLEIRLKDAIRIVWHPFNPNQFVLLHNHRYHRRRHHAVTEEENGTSQDGGSAESTTGPKKKYSVVATFVETTRLMTVKHESENHAVCNCTKPDEIDGGSTNGGSLKLVCFGPKSKVGIHDLSWSNQDARHVVTAHKDGSVRLWDLRDIVSLDVTTGEEVELKQQQNPSQQKDGSVSSGNSAPNNENVVESAKCIMTLNANITNESGVDGEVQRCMFLPSFDDASCTVQKGSDATSLFESNMYNITSPFLTVTKRGTCVTLWSPFKSTCSPPSPIRTFQLDGCAPKTEFNVSFCTIPNAIQMEESSDLSSSPLSLPSSFILFADKEHGNIHALHLNSIYCKPPPSMNTTSGTTPSSIVAVNGFDYIVPFRATQPIYSWTTMVSALSADEDNAEIGEDGWTIDLFCVQSKSVQLLTLTKSMLVLNLKQVLMDGDDVPDGVSVEDLNVGASPLNHLVSNDNDKNEDDHGGVEELSYEDEDYEIDGNDAANGIQYDEYDDDDINYAEEEDDDEGEGKETIAEKEAIVPIGGLTTSSNTASSSSFSNWLGNLAGVSTLSTSETTVKVLKKSDAIVPPTPQITPAQPSKMSMDFNLANVPLPTAPDLELPKESKPKAATVEATPTPTTTAPELSVEKPKPAQRYLSPIEMLASAKKETKQFVAETKAASTPTRSSGGDGRAHTTILKSDKKESKKKSSQKNKNTQPVPIPSKDGKIAILKREDIVGKKASIDKPATTGSASSSVGVTKEEVEEIVRRAVSSHFQKQENVITAEIQKAVRYEVQSGLVPTLNKTVAQTLDQTISKTMKSTVTKSVKESTKINTNELATEIASNLKDPLVDGFYKSMRELMIPAFESGTRQMFDQISTSIEKGLDIKKNEESENVKAMEAMMKRMDAMAKTMEVLIQGVAKVTVAGNSPKIPSNASSAPPVVDKTELLKGKIEELILAEDIEKAFMTALSAQSPDIAVWTCGRSDLSIVLESETPKLSQPIMLCLMQQLGADFSPQKDGDLKVKLAWLQSLALTLNPHNESIRKHFVGVCQQLITNLQMKITEPNVMLRREMQMLIQVIRGISLS